MLCAACLIATGTAALPAPAAVFAAEEEAVLEADGLKYEIADDSVTITGFTSELSGEVTVPAEINGLPVTKIEAGAFKYNAKVTEITLPDSVTEIGQEAFKSCFSAQIRRIAEESDEHCRQYLSGESEACKSDGSGTGQEHRGACVCEVSFAC